MKNNYEWKILSKLKTSKSKIEINQIVDILLNNRGIDTAAKKSKFFNPPSPLEITLKNLDIYQTGVNKAILRIERAIDKGEGIVIYGDYDTDGVCATAILWEVIYSLTDNVKPYIPNRFEEGYGINSESIKALKSQNPNLKLIITVDNGIVANEAVDSAKELGVDVIITDHHKRGKQVPKAYAIIHSDKVSGSGVSWIFARELLRRQKLESERIVNGLDLVVLGTVADQLPLVGVNRSFAKFGFGVLNKTERIGLRALFEEAAIKSERLGTYEVNYVIAPRINAMGRMEHAIDALRLLCTNNLQKAQYLARYLGKTNSKRQKVVEEVVLHARDVVTKSQSKGVIILAHESYHEGVIGLVASRLVEEFYRPAIVLSKGGKYSKASARSVQGFDIIENIRKLDSLILGGGGHPTAAGFKIETEKIEEFSKKFENISLKGLTKKILTKSLNADLEIEFADLSLELFRNIEKFEPNGIGNPAAVFVTRNANVIDARTVGAEGKHLKLKLEKDGIVFNAIAFGKGNFFSDLSLNKKADIVFNLSLDSWNGNESLQLRIKDLMVKDGRKNGKKV